MIIQARDTPLEVLLAIRAFAKDGTLIPRVVYLDTEELAAKQLVLSSDKILFKTVEVSRFCFTATTTALVQRLQDFLPEELHNRIVATTSREQHEDHSA